MVKNRLESKKKSVKKPLKACALGGFVCCVGYLIFTLRISSAEQFRKVHNFERVDKEG